MDHLPNITCDSDPCVSSIENKKFAYDTLYTFSRSFISIHIVYFTVFMASL